MECNQQQTVVPSVKTLYENFIEEKCESDFLIPDYYPAAGKIILCHATPNITKKEVVGDHLIIEGNCRLTVLYSGEEEAEVKAMSETVSFQENFSLKESGKNPWVQTMVRVSGTSCRLLNSRKISAHAMLSVALKVKDQQYTDSIEALECSDIEALFKPMQIHTVLEHVVDIAKVQGELEVPADIREILKTDAMVCVKDTKVFPGKAVVKGVVDLFILYTPESEPHLIRSTSTAIPFTQTLALQSNEEALLDVVLQVQNVRADIENDEDGNSRIISTTITLLTEGELFVSQKHQLLLDAYSNHYPISVEKDIIYAESIVDQGNVSEILSHELELETGSAEIIQIIAHPLIQKITGQKNSLNFEGLLDTTILLYDGERHRSIEKVFTFTVKREICQLNGQMRCEVNPCILNIDWSKGGSKLEIKTEIGCTYYVFSKESNEVISSVTIDKDHPIECDEGTPLVVYYGEKGERIWDIARKYATSVDTIMGLNDLEHDILENKKILLIAR